MAINFAHSMDGVWSEGTLNPDDISKVMIIIYQRLISLGFAKPNNAVNKYGTNKQTPLLIKVIPAIPKNEAGKVLYSKLNV